MWRRSHKKEDRWDREKTYAIDEFCEVARIDEEVDELPKVYLLAKSLVTEIMMLWKDLIALFFF